MPTGYVRQSTGQIVNGRTADASDFNNEYNKLQEAFDITTGHNHTGDTTGNGSRIPPAGLFGLDTNGITVRVNNTLFAARTLTGTSGEVQLVNGDGVAGNPTFSLPTTLTFTGKTINGGTFAGGTIGNTTTVTKSPVITLGGDLAGNVTLTNLANGTLTANLAGLTSGTGYVARTANGAFAVRTITGPTIAQGIVVSNGNGVSGNPQIELANDLLALESLTGTGFATRIADGAWQNRVITGTPFEILVDDGDGFTDNPNLSFPTDIRFPGTARVATGLTVTAGGAAITGNVSVAAGTFISRGISDTATTGRLYVTSTGVGINQTVPAKVLHLGSSTFTQDAAIRLHCGNGTQNRAWELGVRYGGSDVTGTNYHYYIHDISAGADRLSIDYDNGVTTLHAGAIIASAGNATVLTVNNPLNASGDAGCQVFYNGTSWNAYTRVQQTTGHFQFANTGYTQVTAQISQSGAIHNITGTYGTLSDERLKEHIENSRGYLDDLNKLRVVKYALKADHSDHADKLGFVAQEMEQVFPGLIEETPDISGNIYKGIKSSILIPMLVKAVQELTAKVTALEGKRKTTTPRKKAA